MIQSTAVYESRGRYIVEGFDQSTGPEISNGTFASLLCECSDEDLGIEVARVGAATRTGVAAPKQHEYAQLPSAFRFAGASSEQAFRRQAKMVAVVLDGDQVTVFPSRRSGVGYEFLPTSIKRTVQGSAEFGSAIRDGLALSE
jgi:hypothetical protein